MNMRLSIASLLFLVALGSTDFAHAAWDAEREREARSVAETFKTTDKKVGALFDSAWGYVVFPSVGKGGFGIGGAHGEGVVFEQGTAIGTAKLFQVTFGFQFGGQLYSEIVFFETKAALDRFKRGDFKLGAQASAVAVTAGASADVSFHGGVAIFTMIKGGLMYEASVGGQKFTFRPRKGVLVTAAAKRSTQVTSEAAAASSQAKQKDDLSAAARYEAAKNAFAAGRYQEAHDQWLESAHQGHAASLYELGKMFGEGQGVLQDFVTAHAYFNVAAARGHKEAVEARQILDNMMTDEERAAARKRATEYWKSFGQ